MSEREMEVRRAAAPEDIARATTDELRARFLVQGIFPADRVRLVYSHIDRLILGGAMPVNEVVELGDGAAIGTPFLLSAREMGIANLGGPARVTVDGEAFELARRDVLYVGRGSRVIRLESRDPAAPAKLYLNSCAAQQTHPCRLIRLAEAEPGAGTGHQRHLAREIEQARGHRILAKATGATSLYSWFSPVMPQTKA